MTLFDDLYTLWTNYVDYSVVENHAIKDIMFHVFLGTVLTHKGYRYMESGARKSVRLHFFMIQDSGTGKSQLMKAYHNLLVALGIKARITVVDNEAALTGCVYLLPDKMYEKRKEEKKRAGEPTSEQDRVVTKKGLLSELLSLCWDEGSVLLQMSKFMVNITNYFQCVMDEPGRVSKGMRLGTIEYYSDCTVIAGSYMFTDFKNTLLTKGFLQRMFLHYKKFTPQEKRNLRIGVNLLKRKKKPEDIRKLTDAIKVWVAKIPELPEKTIQFDDKDIQEFNNDLEEIYQKYIDKAFTGEKQDVLETFNGKLHILIDKIAAQRAIILGKSVVEKEDLDYAKGICMKHVHSLIAIFNYLVGGTDVVSIPEHREAILMNILTSRGGKLIQKDLLDEIHKLKKLGKWDLGWNGTLKLIDEMIAANKIKCDVGKQNRKMIYV